MLQSIVACGEFNRRFDASAHHCSSLVSKQSSSLGEELLYQNCLPYTPQCFNLAADPDTVQPGITKLAGHGDRIGAPVGRRILAPALLHGGWLLHHVVHCTSTTLIRSLLFHELSA